MGAEDSRPNGHEEGSESDDRVEAGETEPPIR